MTTDPAGGGPTAGPREPGGLGGEGATLLVTGTGMVAISAPTALQVVWLVAVCGVAAARAVGRRSGATGVGADGPSDGGPGAAPPP